MLYVKKNWTYFLVVLFLISIIFYGILKERNYSNYIGDDRTEKRYTVGEIDHFQGGAKTSPFFEYSYNVGSKSYSDKFYINGELRKKKSSELKKYLNKRFYVLYVLEDPSYSKLLIEKPVIDSLLQIQTGGKKFLFKVLLLIFGIIVRI
ncbi:hypothetical protein [Salegentibacter salinarum]|uniref:hypothetical protein n=1 Tax=Salegentibacter salinarum TaxID=447422 RepID=UPI000C2FF537|nr:hypothetical protein [Salegentibacter salinarum]